MTQDGTSRWRRDRQATPVFEQLGPVPDHRMIETDVLERWARDDTFGRLRRKINGGPPFSFIDGPVTANKTLGVHTAWGRTLKDVFQRYKASRGYDLRFQNGFDCQGLWIEVGVEQELGLNSKKDIEAYGLEEFARKCHDKVAWSIRELTAGSKRLGYWMDWGNDYLTFSDTNIEFIWRFLKHIDGKRLLYLGQRSTEWCPRCGTSISQHEISMSGVYQQRTDPSLYVRLPITERQGEALVVWTTTPWTLPANVAAAVHPDYEYGRRPNGDWVAVALYSEDQFEERRLGRELEGLTYRGPFDHLEPASGIVHKVVTWDEVTLDQGTGVVHIAPGCGAADFDLALERGLEILTPVDESGRFLPEYGALSGLTTSEAYDRIVEHLQEGGRLVANSEHVHSYPHCWRCDTPLIFRVAEDWHIAVSRMRRELLDANDTIDWTPEYMGKLMRDWLTNMGDWNISRRRYYGLPLPIYPCSCGQVTVIGSKAELLEKATSGLEQLEELRRPWIDRVKIRCEACGNREVARVPEVGDVWLDAGIVPFSTLGWNNPEHIEAGHATGAAAELSTADLPDHAYWEKWFPADWVTEMREQVRLWFYSQLVMSVALVGRAPFRTVLGYEKMLAEDGREMHGSWGNLISAEEAFTEMGADVMRWMYSSHRPDRNLAFGYDGARDVRRKLITLWNSARFLTDYANIEGFVPSYADLESGPTDVELREIDRWLLARRTKAVAITTDALDRWRVDQAIEELEGFLDDLSNWYIRRNRRRFYERDEAAFRTLWVALATALRIVGPVAPFLSDYLWRALVAGPCLDAPDSVHLAEWPARLDAADELLLREMAMTRRIVEVGRRARVEANLKLRQPLRRAVIRQGGSAARHADVIRDELRIKELEFDDKGPAEVTLRPDFRAVGPRLGSKVQEVAQALAAGDYKEQPNGAVSVAGETLSADELVRTEKMTIPGWVHASDGEVTIALDPNLDDELLLEGAALELIRSVNDQRKAEGFELTDRVLLKLPPGSAAVVDRYGELIAAEVLATSIVVESGVNAPQLAKAPPG